ncbi:FoF1 ATP synthase subunit B' [Campylobacter gastrosuis]|uniref:FoF1 ATP synthase subunit B n=1 Tax=Campylobacter gastrosuis TaxID=2974576 RepID=A0ABT7HQA9_9BACT|nr:FoF1 ATP synthase subunit B' [Campylobacter gastrosuis]MDL0088907.1 FoF1 ATP synthase subunit B' [Campylobacter gastrosuis]
MLEINPPLVVLTAIVFLGLIAILNSLLYKPMLKFIDERNASIKADEESVSQNANDLGAYEAQIQSIIADARSEANKIKQEAIDAAKNAAADEISSKKTALEAEYTQFLNALNAQKDELKASLLVKLPELKTALNGKLSRI